MVLSTAQARAPFAEYLEMLAGVCRGLIAGDLRSRVLVLCSCLRGHHTWTDNNFTTVL